VLLNNNQSGHSIQHVRLNKRILRKRRKILNGNNISAVAEPNYHED